MSYRPFALILTLLVSAAVKAGDKIELKMFLITGVNYTAAHKKLELVKGGSATLLAKVFKNGEEKIRSHVNWNVSSSDVLEIKDLGYGAVRVTALRDLFDEPRTDKEPTTELKACFEDDCQTIVIVCLIDASGEWELVLKFNVAGFVPHEEKRRTLFLQNGRQIKFAAEPGYAENIKIEEKKMSLMKGGALTKFNGLLLSRHRAEGNFASIYGYSGRWTAVRAP